MNNDTEAIDIAKNLILNVIELGPTALNNPLLDNNGLISNEDGEKLDVETSFMDCPQERVANVIGSRGIVINDIMRRTGCKIVINQDVPDGKPAAVEITCALSFQDTNHN